MAVEMKKINFQDFQEPAVGAENLNQMQKNIEDAINEGVGSGDGILTGSVIGYEGDTIPEGYEEVENPIDPSDLLTELANPTLTIPTWYADNVSSQNGGYYKIGKLVIIDITCKFTKTSAGGVFIADLPAMKRENLDAYQSANMISLSDNSVAPAVIQDVDSGTIIKGIPQNTSNTYRISGFYVCE